MCLGSLFKQPKVQTPAPPPIPQAPPPPPTPSATDGQANEADARRRKRRQLQAGLASTIKAPFNLLGGSREGGTVSNRLG